MAHKRAVMLPPGVDPQDLTPEEIAALPELSLYEKRQWQEDCSRSNIRRPHGRTVLVVPRRFGKTVMSVGELVEAALYFDPPGGLASPGRFAYIAPELGQAKRNAWAYLKQLALKIPGTTVSEGELYVQLDNGSRINLYGADDPNRLRGLYLDGCVMDELAQMKPDAWFDVVQVALSDSGRNGWALFIGTVKGVNLLSELYQKGLKDKSGRWISKLYTVYDADVYSPEEIARLKEDMPDASFRREFMNDFSAGHEGQLISFDLAYEASRRDYKRGDYSWAPKILGVDVGYANDGDPAVISLRQGLVLFEQEVYQGISNMRLAERVARAWDRSEADACFVDYGRGEGVISRLTDLGYPSIGVHFGGTPADKRFTNMSAQMAFSMAEWLESGGAIPDDEELRAEMCSVVFEHVTSNDKIKLESKKEAKKRGLPSPNKFDSAKLTFAMPVAAKARPHDSLWQAEMLLNGPRGMAKMSGHPFDS